MTDDITVPDDLDMYIGQPELKKKLQVYIDHSRRIRRPLPHMLFVSDPGCGKTSLAHVISNEAGDPIVSLDLSKLKNNDLSAFLLYGFEGGILFCDEVDKARPNQQRDLLTLAEEGYVDAGGGMRVEVPWLTLILATTRPEKLELDLVERMQFKPKWASYADEELAAIVEQMADGYTEMPKEMARALGRAAGGTPRHARDMVRAYDALSSGGREVTVEDVLGMVDIDAEGLTADHLTYLQALLALGGTAGEGRIANQMRTHVSMVRRLERLLHDRGYVRASSSGRVLTPAGHAKTGGARPRYERKAS